jgi:apolipoprotein N-acyltransferase
MNVILNNKKIILSLISGLLLVLSFPEIGNFAFISFVALIPLLFVEKEIFDKNLKSKRLFFYSYLVFFIYNIGTTWWIWNASKGGAILAFVLNSLIMSTTFQLFHITKKKMGEFIGYLSMVFYWITFEYFHYEWELSWPWLNFGNIFANHIEFVQWYSITGVLGGTLWILLTNLFLFFAIQKFFFDKNSDKTSTVVYLVSVLVIVLPILISVYQYANSSDVGIDTEVVVAQPNVDPYNEKFTGSVENQLDKMCDLIDQKATNNTDFILAPETALPFTFYEDEIDRIIYFHYLVNRKAFWNNASLLIGASTKRFFKNKKSRASRKLMDGPGYEEYYNSSMMIDFHDKPKFIHKSKLVLGVEKVPFSNIFPFLEKLSINNGGASGTLGIEDYAQVFTSKNKKIAPVVCYESIYGNYVAEQSRKGAELIFVITNDGWWGDTPGYKQHFAFSRLRAIENRKSVARSANTGISGFINQRGDVLNKSAYWNEAVLSHVIKRNKTKTFYAQNGDWIGRSFVLGSLIFLFVTLANIFKKIFYKDKL